MDFNKRVARMALHFSKLTQGHGSLRGRDFCNHAGCNPATSERHFQERAELAEASLKELTKNDLCHKRS